MKNAKAVIFFSLVSLVTLVIGCGGTTNLGSTPTTADSGTTKHTASSSASSSASTSAPPTITSATTAAITQGASFSYQISATNSPIEFAATGLPAGLTLDSSTGRISGTVLGSSQITVDLAATNQFGQGTAQLTLVPSNAPDTTGTTHNCNSGVAAPAAAATAQFTRLAFCDDFDSASTIDTQATGNPGFKWYVHRLYDTYPQAAYQVKNSALTVADVNYAYNWGLTTTDIRTGAGASWTFGYFEARVDFDPTLGPAGPGWPSFWSFSTAEAETRSQSQFAELDFFEGSPQQSPGNYWGAYGATLHDWHTDTGGGYTDYMNGKNIFPSGVSWSNWHVLGCLWVKGQVTWYLDGKIINTQSYSPSGYGTPEATDFNGSAPVPPGVFSDLDSEPQGMMLILGSGPKWPMHVDWVRVWQQ